MNEHIESNAPSWASDPIESANVYGATGDLVGGVTFDRAARMWCWWRCDRGSVLKPATSREHALARAEGE